VGLLDADLRDLLGTGTTAHRRPGHHHATTARMETPTR
jgi:hypothetical protein